MFRNAGTVLWSVLNKPLFGTRVIPRDAAVDPKHFSEDEYPVHCPKCGYLLRGLPDGRCPECGTPFERGRLLVQQYVREWKGASLKDSRAGKWCSWASTACIALPVLSCLGFVCIAYLVDWESPNPPSWITPDWVFRVVCVLFAIFVVGFVLQVAALTIAFMTLPRGARRRRRAVMNALRDGES